MSHSAPCYLRSWGTQFWWLLKRSLVAQLRNPTDVTSRLLLSCWIGLLAGARPCLQRFILSSLLLPVHLKHTRGSTLFPFCERLPLTCSLNAGFWECHAI